MIGLVLLMVGLPMILVIVLAEIAEQFLPSYQRFYNKHSPLFPQKGLIWIYSIFTAIAVPCFLYEPFYYLRDLIGEEWFYTLSVAINMLLVLWFVFPIFYLITYWTWGKIARNPLIFKSWQFKKGASAKKANTIYGIIVGTLLVGALVFVYFYFLANNFWRRTPVLRQIQNMVIAAYIEVMVVYPLIHLIVWLVWNKIIWAIIDNVKERRKEKIKLAKAKAKAEEEARKAAEEERINNLWYNRIDRNFRDCDVVQRWAWVHSDYEELESDDLFGEELSKPVIGLKEPYRIHGSDESDAHSCLRELITPESRKYILSCPVPFDWNKAYRIATDDKILGGCTLSPHFTRIHKSLTKEREFADFAIYLAKAYITIVDRYYWHSNTSNQKISTYSVNEIRNIIISLVRLWGVDQSYVLEDFSSSSSVLWAQNLHFVKDHKA